MRSSQLWVLGEKEPQNLGPLESLMQNTLLFLLRSVERARTPASKCPGHLCPRGYHKGHRDPGLWQCLQPQPPGGQG